MTLRWGLNQEEESKEAQSSPQFLDIATAQGSVRHVDNTIYFYSDVATTPCAELNRLLREVDAKLNAAKHMMLIDDYTPTIHVRINSYGGDMFAGLSTIDTIRSLKSRVYTYVEGAAASAATLISISGTKRFMGKNSFMLIHQLSSISAGTFEQLEDCQENNKRMMALIKNIYKQYTKIPMKELEAILKHDLWMDSTACLSHGLVDAII